uniref:Uncharacterized protein n=1 Tax=Lates calcarifer TaxID=8187 RepID=A0A4W6DMG7_LATCA
SIPLSSCADSSSHLLHSGLYLCDEQTDLPPLSVLQSVLEKLQSRKLSSLDRRQSHLPTCEVGASCLVKKGPRFGRLCDCPRPSTCNFFFLRCL